LRHFPFPNIMRIPNSQQNQQFPAFPWLQGDLRMKAATCIITVCIAVAASTPLNGFRVMIAPIRTDECLAAGVIPGDGSTHQSHPGMAGNIVLIKSIRTG